MYEAKERRRGKWERKNKQKNCAFCGCKEKGFFVKMAFFRKMGKHYLCSEGKKSAHFHCNYLFSENGPCFVAIQSHQTLLQWGFQQAQGKTQNGTFVFKSAILGRGLERELYYYYICDTLKLCFAENTGFIVFSAEYSFADIKECNSKKTFPKVGVVCQNAKRCFYGLFFCFFGGFVFFLCVFVILFCEGPKKLFSCNFIVFLFNLFPQKACL